MKTSEQLKQIVKEKYSEIADQSREENASSVSDIVLKGDLPEGLRSSAEMYAGCVSGAIQKDDYLSVVREAGFTAIKLQKERKITILDEILSVYLNTREKERYWSGELGIYSITLYPEKPVAGSGKEACCEPGCCAN